MSDADFNPQPDPPGARTDFNPQPEPPGASQDFNPQPEPPGVSKAPSDSKGDKADGAIIHQ